MKKFLKSAYVKTYLTLLITILTIEIIFKLISNFPIFDWSLLRIFIGLNIFSAIVSYILNVMKTLTKKIVISIIVFGCSFYACVQAGFFNFLGVYISFQTSSQLGAVTDYIREFILSFKWYFFLTFIPFIILLIWFIFFDKKKRQNLYIWQTSIISGVIILIMASAYYLTISLNVFQNNFQSVSNKELFQTVSNPSLSVSQFGSIGFAVLDFKALLFPAEMETVYAQENESEEIDEFTRIIDDKVWESLIERESNSVMNSLNEYFINRKITAKNEYTGLFEGKNLIMIMMESVNDIFLDPQYYPNFNKLVSEGWYWENNYSPRNSCATMNNEFSGLTSLYSIYNTCTASKYKSNTYYESMFNVFNQNDYITFSAHNYTQAYYPRKTIHTNLGSGEYYGVEKLKIPYSSEYRNWSNDDDFMNAVLKIIDSKTSINDTFMTWLTTVSSHQPYSISSIQGDKYYDMTKGTKYPSDVRRYMSKLKILDNALGVLLEGLEARGILEDTVIVLYGDHYPYGIPTKNLNKVLDYNTASDMNAERVPFVIYNSEIEPHVFSEYTFYLNILPTLANLFNLDYDPRLYLGTDLFSEDYESLVVFADNSWKNERAYYDASKSKIKYYSSNEYSKEEIMAINDEIKTEINISNLVIKNDYFNYLDKALEKIAKTIDEEQNSACPLFDYCLINEE